MTNDNRSTELTLKAKVLGAIASGRVAMRPRWHFVMKSVLIVAGAVLAFVALLFLASLVFFALRQSGALFLPAFGRPGLRLLFFAVPWLLVAAAALFLAIFALFVRRYPFAYKKPVAYTAVTLLVVGLLGGYALARTDMHPRLYRFQIERRIPGAEGFYRHFGAPRPDTVFPGEMIEYTDRGFLLETIDNRTFEVIVATTTRFPAGSELSTGDRVLVVGDAASGTVRAFGVRPLPNEGVFVPAPPVPRAFKVRMKVDGATTSDVLFFRGGMPDGAFKGEIPEPPAL